MKHVTPDALTKTMAPHIVVAVLAHNEERRIGGCLQSLPLNDPSIDIHVIVNGTTDTTAEIARSYPVTVHDWEEGGKSRSWSRFVLDHRDISGDAFVFVDGDALVAPGSVQALARVLREDPDANAVAALPGNGRKAQQYRSEMIRENTMFGDLYALSGAFVERMRESGIRLPEDLIGDDGLVCALAKSDLGGEDQWREDRVPACLEAEFFCEPASLASPGTLVVQYRRMINYSVRHFQNRIIKGIMGGPGPQGMPARLADLYPQWLPGFRPRRSPVWYWFDRCALRRMRNACQVSGSDRGATR